MAIAFDAASQGDATTATTVTVSHTTTGSNRFLLVAAYTYTGSGTPDIPTVTYNGVSMTQVQTLLFGASTDERVTLFRLVAPATGTNNIVLTVSTTHAELGLTAVSYSGVDQTTPLDTPSTLATTGVTSSSIAISSATGDVVVDCIAWYNQTITVGAGQTQRVLNDNGATLDSVAMSDEPGASSVTMSWSWAASENPGHIAVNMNVATAATVNVDLDAAWVSANTLVLKQIHELAGSVT